MRPWAGLPLALGLAGCGGGRAPALEVLGTYFPAWLVAALIGVLGAVLARVGLMVTGLDQVVPWLLAVCASIGLIVAIAAASAIFG